MYLAKIVWTESPKKFLPEDFDIQTIYFSARPPVAPGSKFRLDTLRYTPGNQS